MEGKRRYWAFISYSHKDRHWARWLHRALEGYVVPRRLVGLETTAGQVPRRLRPIFRDREELPVHADLRERVNSALLQSSCLIVVCSPDAARSTWVRDEIVRFKSLHGESRVFAVIVGGTPKAGSTTGGQVEECFPDALRFHIDPNGSLTETPAEIIAADLRPHGDGRRLARLKVVAGVLGVELDDLVRRDALRRGRQLTTLSVASIAVALVMGALAVEAIRSRDEAREQRGHADDFVEFMINYLGEKMKPSERLDLLSAIADKARSYYAEQAKGHLDSDELGRMARVFHLLGYISEKSGNLGDADRYFRKAADATAALLSIDPKNSQRLFEHAQSSFWEGYIAQRRGDRNAVENNYTKYKNIMETLARRDPGNIGWLSEAAASNIDLGTAYLGRGDAGAAISLFSRSLLVNKLISDRAPGDRDKLVAVLGSYAWLADTESQHGALREAFRDRLDEKSDCDKILTKYPDDNEVADDLVVARMAIGGIFLKMGQNSESIKELNSAIALSDKLMLTDGRITSYGEHAASALILLSRAYQRSGMESNAGQAANRAIEIIEHLISIDGTVAIWRGPMLGDARIAAVRSAAERARTTSNLQQALYPMSKESTRLSLLLQKDPSDIRLITTSAEAKLLEGDYEILLGRKSKAKTVWSTAKGLLLEAQRLHPAYVGDRRRLIFIQTSDRLSAKNSPMIATGASKVQAIEAQVGRSAVRFDYAW